MNEEVQRIKPAWFLLEDKNVLEPKLGCRISIMQETLGCILYTQGEDIFMEYSGFMEHGNLIPYDESRVSVKVWLGSLDDKVDALRRFKLHYLARLHGASVFEHLDHYFLVDVPTVGMYRERCIADLMYMTRCDLGTATDCIDHCFEPEYLGYGLRQAILSAQAGLMP